MKYTSNEQINLDEAKQKIQKKGFSEKTKKLIGSALLASQVMGAAPVYASDQIASKYDLQGQSITVQSEMGEIFNEINIKEYIDKMDIEEIKKRLNQYEPDMYTLENLNTPGYYEEDELRRSLLPREVQRLDEEILKKFVMNLPIEDVKKRLEDKHYWHDENEINENELRKNLYENEEVSSTNFPSQKRVELSIEKYKEYLQKLNISDDVRKTLLSNLVQNLTSVKMGYTYSGLKGLYNANNKSLIIGNFGTDNKSGDIIDETDLRDIWAHEMTHAATLSKFQNDLDDMCEHDKSDYAITSKDKRRVGFQYLNIGGVALNEGMTEYFSNKLLEKNGHEKFVLYPMYVLIVKDLVDLYGENAVIEAFVKSPERLEELMDKDGKCFVEFMELLDESYFAIYLPKNAEKGMTIVDTIKSEEAQNKWNKVGRFIEDIKEKRMKENPGLVLPKSKWKEAEEYTKYTMEQNDQYAEQILKDEKGTKKVLVSEKNPEIEESIMPDSSVLAAQTLPVEAKKNNKIVEWFKNIKEKIVSKFKKEEEPLLLNAGAEEISLSQKRNEFLESIKVNEEDLIVQNESTLGMEKINERKIENDELVR